MWSESGAGIDVGPLGALEAWHEKGEAPRACWHKARAALARSF